MDEWSVPGTPPLLGLSFSSPPTNHLTCFLPPPSSPSFLPPFNNNIYRTIGQREAMSWNCQRCRQPLLLSPSVSSELDLNQSAYDLVQDSFIARRPKDFSKLSTPATNDDASCSLLLNPSKSPTDPNSLSARLAVSSALFDLLSQPPSIKPGSTQSVHHPSPSHSNLSINTIATIDHPLCKECTDLLLEIMDQQMNELRRQRDGYLAFEAELGRYSALGNHSSTHPKQQIDSNHDDSEHQQQRLQQEIESLEQEEKKAIQQLQEAETDRLSIQQELLAVEQEEKLLQQEEERFWSQYSAHSLTLERLCAQQASLRTVLRHDSAQLARLQLTNVYNDAFCIGHDGGFATINGLRLGRLAGASVEWTEINAAWGQTALLLDTLARKLGVVFSGYRVVPKGSFSTVHKLDGDRAVYELYGSGDWPIGRLLQSRRFDHAMVGFLDCLRQLAGWASERDQTLRLPHPINRDRIGEASIRLQFGQDETWTRALRHVLLTLKVLLSWTVQNEDDG